MVDLATLVREEIRKYAGSGSGLGLALYPIFDDEHRTYAVNAVHVPPAERGSGIVVQARIVGQRIVIDVDNTDKQLIDALLQREIPREQIVLGYRGETVA